MPNDQPRPAAAFIEITRKDLRLLLRDRRALVVLVILPIAFIAILGLSTGRLLGWRASNQTLRIAVLDLADSDQSQLVVRRLNELDGLLTTSVSTADDLQQLLSDRDANAGLTIGEKFTERMESVRADNLFDLQQSRIQASLSDFDVGVETPAGGAMVKSVVEQLTLFSILQTALPQATGLASLKSFLPETSAEADVPVVDREDGPVDHTVSSAESANTGNPVYQTIVPGYTVMFAFFLVNIMARSFIAERELGTLARLRIAPVSAFDVVIGKTLPFLVISLLQCGSLFLVGRLLFGMSWGQSPWLLLPILLCTSLAATGLGLLVSTSVRTDSQVSAYANFLVITLAGISGCFMPRDWLPETMQSISLAVPHAWALIAFREALADRPADVTVIARACLVLTGFATAFLTIGCWRFRRMI
ncbi:MAG: ABC transporter permease [Planctomycetota bacterium]|jgi:ABC-2 type transport system permease protein